MSAAKLSFLVFLGAGIGALGRYWIGSLVQTRFGGPFPWGTLVVNASGGLLIGIAMGLILQKGWDPCWRLFLVTGVLGGYTTFSAFGYEAMQLFENRHVGLAAAYILSSNIASISLCFLGSTLTKLALGRV